MLVDLNKVKDKLDKIRTGEITEGKRIGIPDIDNFINKSVLVKADIAENILTKTSAKEALSYLSDENNVFPDIIFLDIRMPEMDGFEFLEECVNFPDHLKSKCTFMQNDLIYVG